ncbi:cwf18 pre-mRNA splicing factor-domain-containing protein [Staphylotrichum tortipilum]|uniref:Cwf18 pre-mRNA splicing factor-domain-containing protein n=1 Tax=Staphylotrichum tortipilum TaxID=2831512 RepID=A0AAN6MSD1_9PEZI|nr:cwf18 pre-mRNA splicing factor-domain-containing protein [Staphylotrichum longicolle]
MSSHATLDAAADDRKARLAKLKNLKRKQPTTDADDTTTTTSTPLVVDDSTSAAPPSPPVPPTQDVARLHLSGRNYDFATKSAKLGFEAPPTLSLTGPTLEQQAGTLSAAAQAQQETDATDAKAVDLFTLQPKKPNWDLKRELGTRMEVLNVRTDNAIARMVRERLAERKAAAEAAGGAAQGEEEGMLEGAAIVEGMRLREREEEEENRREREAEAEEFAGV